MERLCVDGKEHGEVLTAGDDPDRFDPGVFAAHSFVPPNDNQWGYCVDCSQPFRWSVPRQRWLAWPGGFGMLPQLTSEELEVLESAIGEQQKAIEAALGMPLSQPARSEFTHRASILHSLVTAVSEAQHGLWEPDEEDDDPAAYLRARGAVGGDEPAEDVIRRSRDAPPPGRP